MTFNFTTEMAELRRLAQDRMNLREAVLQRAERVSRDYAEHLGTLDFKGGELFKFNAETLDDYRDLLRIKASGGLRRGDRAGLLADQRPAGASAVPDERGSEWAVSHGPPRLGKTRYTSGSSAIHIIQMNRTPKPTRSARPSRVRGTSKTWKRPSSGVAS
jgi:hypothetical protein